MGQGASSQVRSGNPISTLTSTMDVDTATTQPPKQPQQQQQQQHRKVGIKTGKPICCCCPDTKLPRDECIVANGEDHPDCIKLIEAHKVCLREEGFDVK